MKIYILPVNEELQPLTAKFVFPSHHAEDYGVEQDFLGYLLANRKLLTNDLQAADFHYLPVFWTRWMFNHESGYQGNDLLQRYVDQAILDDSKTFTVCHISMGKQVRLGKTIVFWASRRSPAGIDLPLICQPLSLPVHLPDKKYLASFMGHVPIHPIRQEMLECFKDITDIDITTAKQEVDLYIEKILESYITLCPRGAGGSSFRFFETMQLGVVPFLIGDMDTRPFKKYIGWDNFSFYTETPKQAVELICDWRSRKAKLVAMGKQCAKIWLEKITYGKWCKYLLKELNNL